MPKAAVAQTLVILGAVLIAAGTAGLLGWEAGTLVAGAEAVVYGGWFVDVDPPSERGRR